MIFKKFSQTNGGIFISEEDETLNLDNKTKPFREGSPLFKEVYCKDKNCSKFNPNICKGCVFLPPYYKA